MTNTVLHSTSEPDGILHLDILVGLADTEFEVEVKVRPAATGRTLPPGYFDLIGLVDDETLAIQPQPPLPPAMEVEWLIGRVSPKVLQQSAGRAPS